MFYWRIHLQMWCKWNIIDPLFVELLVHLWLVAISTEWKRHSHRKSIAPTSPFHFVEACLHFLGSDNFDLSLPLLKWNCPSAQQHCHQPGNFGNCLGMPHSTYWYYIQCVYTSKIHGCFRFLVCLFSCVPVEKSHLESTSSTKQKSSLACTSLQWALA